MLRRAHLGGGQGAPQHRMRGPFLPHPWNPPVRSLELPWCPRTPETRPQPVPQRQASGSLVLNEPDPEAGAEAEKTPHASPSGWVGRGGRLESAAWSMGLVFPPLSQWRSEVPQGSRRPGQAGKGRGAGSRRGRRAGASTCRPALRTSLLSGGPIFVDKKLIC